MSPGPHGFGQGVFPGETQVFDNDMPKLDLLFPTGSIVKKKPACRKRPASMALDAPQPEADEHEEQGGT